MSMIRDTIEITKDKTARATAPKLPADDLKVRQAAVENARHELRLEGLAMSEGAAALQQRWAAGELTGDEVIEQLKALHHRAG